MADKKIKVIHIVDDLKVGGLERTLAMVALGLDKAKYDVRVWCLARGGEFADRLRKEGLEPRIFSFASSPKIKAYVELIRALRREKPVITHSWGLSGGVIGRVASIFAGVPARILHVQNIYDGTSYKDRFIDWALSHFTVKIISCADAVKGSLVRFMHISPEKIQAIYNSVDLKLFGEAGDRALARSELGIGADDILVGSASRLVPIKGQSYLLEALVRVMGKDPRVKAVIIGDGPSKGALEGQARALRISDRVVFTGVRDDMPRMMRAMDIFVLPSTTYEGLPLAITEAHASRLPVVAADIGGVREIVANMETGLLIPPRDAPAIAGAIMAIINDPGLAERLGKAGRKRCEEKFSLTVMIRNIEALYERCLR